MIAFNVYTCDEWKSCDSMRSLGVFTNKAKLKKFLRLLVKKNYFYVDDNRHIESLDVVMLNNTTDYLFIDKIELNEGDS
jgi:hypothetical protein